MKKILLNSENYHVAFEQVTQLLNDYEPLWRHKPFVEDDVPWNKDSRYGQLYQMLLNLSEQQVQLFEDEACLIDWLSELLPSLSILNSWQIAERFDSPLSVAKFADVGMPGRKKQQIEHFAGAFAPFYRGFNSVNEGIVHEGIVHKGIVDWCCGKGHLAGHLHRQFKCFTLGLEYDEQLVDAGRKNAVNTKGGESNLHYQCVNVLEPLDDRLFDDVSWHTGLHACGDLHVALLKKAVHLGHGAAIAPCCYHLIQTQYYQPLSSAGKQANLLLNKDDLRLAVLQTVTSGERVKRLRQTELLWRTGFDLWYREFMQLKSYTHQSSVQKHWFSGEFVDFCRYLADCCNVSLPATFDGEYYLRLACEKMARVKRLEFVRLGFRPAMELWLLLDRILYLSEQGYEVDVLRFCENKLTPRNSLIIARALDKN